MRNIKLPLAEVREKFDELEALLHECKSELHDQAHQLSPYGSVGDLLVSAGHFEFTEMQIGAIKKLLLEEDEN